MLMRRLILLCTLLSWSAAATAAGIRAPSCDALAAFAFGARADPVEVSFGKPPAAMTVDEFDQALDIVAVCLDALAAAPADVPGLPQRERKRTRIGALTRLAEDLKLYRERQRENERRAAERK